MHWKQIAGRLIAAALVSTPIFLHKNFFKNSPFAISGLENIKLMASSGEGEEDEGEKAEFNKRRLEHEYKMLRNPRTGRIPDDFHERELAAARNIPMRNRGRHPFLNGIMGTEGAQVNNNYTSVGPNNVAGRSRTLAWDRRNPAIMLTGGVTGGIFRSTDGGQNWTFVSPEDDIRSVTSIVQDPTSPDVWYCGTGEVFYPFSQAATATTFGHGIFKSTDNGATWTKLNATIVQNDLNQPDNVFDLVHRLAVHPTTGHVYAAVHNAIMRSADKGVTWTPVLFTNDNTSVFAGITEILIPANGSRIFAAFSGGGPDSRGVNDDRNIAGVWQSATGAAGSWTRIAGGERGQVDSVAGWRPFGRWGRIVLAANGAGNQLFVLYKNGEDAEQGRPEADLFRANLSAALPNNAAWANLSAWVPDEPNYNEPGIDPYTTQFEGYNMSIQVKPDNDNIIFIGGTNLHRVHLNENDPAKKFRRIGGYGGGFFPNEQSFAMYPDHHPDVHGIYYVGGNNNTLYTVSDGGVHKTTTTDMADTVRWEPLNNELQTVQYQFISIIPDPQFDWIMGGAQDNGTFFNQNIVEREHFEIGSGDGASAAFSAFAKTGNNWKQYWYLSVSNGGIYRSNFDWRLDNGTLRYVNNNFTEITPNGRQDEGQWLTLFLVDPDSTNHMYYASDNRLYRTLDAPDVTANNWTEISGVRSAVPSSSGFSAMALSKLPGKNGGENKRLFLGTDEGRVYRLDSVDKRGFNNRPVNITPANMTNNSYVAGIAVNPRNPDTVMVVVSNYDDGSNIVHNIFWTGNATSATPTWQILDGALEPVSVQSCAIVVKNSGVEYYVGTSVGLYSTTAINGESTVWLNEGSGMLKRAIVRTLWVRPEDNALAVGTHGNGAFYTVIGDAIAYNGEVLPPPTTGSNFITTVAPTVTNNAQGEVKYFVGNAAVTRISVQVYNSIGQLLFREERGYANNMVNFRPYAPGVYYLRIMSVDGKQKLVQKIVKQ